MKESHQTTKGKTKRKRKEQKKYKINWKTVENDNKYIYVNNYLKCQWIKCSNQKTYSGRLGNEAKAYNSCLQKLQKLFTKTHFRAKHTHTETEAKGKGMLCKQK